MLPRPAFTLLAAIVALTSFNPVVVSTAAPGLSCPFGVLPAVVPCEADRREQHNSSTGYCDDSNNCICNFDNGGVERRELLGQCIYQFGLDISLPICQCLNKTTIEQEALYEALCTGDCRCEHGAASGHCNWDTFTCKCEYPSGFVWEDTPFGQSRPDCVAGATANITLCTGAAPLTNSVTPVCFGQ